MPGSTFTAADNSKQMLFHAFDLFDRLAGLSALSLQIPHQVGQHVANRSPDRQTPPSAPSTHVSIIDVERANAQTTGGDRG